MVGFCSECGQALGADNTCPAGHHCGGAGAAPMVAGRNSRLPRIDLPKARILGRLLGAGIEFLSLLTCFFLLSITTWFTGGLLGFLTIPLIVIYLAVRDMNAGGNCLGKRIGRYRLVARRDGRPASNGQGFVRNIYYAGLALMMIPPFLRIIPTVLFTMLVSLDFLMILCSPKGRRLGDVFAGTQVVPVEEELAS